MILNPVQSVGSLSVNVTGLFTESFILVGKGHRLSATLSWEIFAPFFGKWSMVSHLCDSTWDIRCSLTEAGTGIWGNLFR